MDKIASQFFSEAIILIVPAPHRCRKQYPAEMGVENGANGTYTTNGTNGLRPTHQHTGLIGLICPIGLISLNAKSPLIGIENNTRQYGVTQKNP